MSDNKKYKYSEVFFSFQGEGTYTGCATAWIRFFLCNLQCNGFLQDDPTNPETYILPYQNIDVKNYSKLEDLPVFERGCDSSYSWSARFKHLQHSGTAAELCAAVEKTIPCGKFRHPETGLQYHMAFTGGEPLLKHNQPAIIAMMRHWEQTKNLPMFVTIETNGTQPLSEEFCEWAVDYKGMGGELFFSVSPKLFTVSGEKNEDAILPEIIRQYGYVGSKGHLKFVVRNVPECWAELESVVSRLKTDRNIMEWPVFGMPVGATKESQETKDTAGTAVELISRGYHVSGRLHCHIFGNGIGT